MSKELATVDEAPRDVVTVEVTTKKGATVQARVPAALAEAYPSLGQLDEIAELLAEVFEDTDATLSITDLPRAKVPSGESKFFQVGDDAVKAIEGILIVRQERRNYWEKSISEGGGNQAPDCFSRDGVHGRGVNGQGSTDNPSGLCADCPFAQWAENGENRVPPPCKPQEAQLILTKDSAFPLLLTVPRTSMKASRDYVKRTLLAGKMKSPVEVVTKISMRTEKSAENLDYNVLVYEIAEDITAGMTREEKRAYKIAPLTLAEEFRGILTNLDTSRDTEAPERSTPVTVDPEGGFSVADDAIDDYAGQAAG